MLLFVFPTTYRVRGSRGGRAGRDGSGEDADCQLEDLVPREIVVSGGAEDLGEFRDLQVESITTELLDGVFGDWASGRHDRTVDKGKIQNSG